MWEVQYLQKRKGKNKALLMVLGIFILLFWIQCYVLWCNLSEYTANDNHCFLLIRFKSNAKCV